MIFYLNLFKAIKFAVEVINMNRLAPNLQLGLGTNYDVGSCIQQCFLFFPGTNSAKKSNKRFKYSFFAMFCFNIFAVTADGKLSYNFLCHISFPNPNCKLGADLFISITLRANLIALNTFK